MSDVSDSSGSTALSGGHVTVRRVGLIGSAGLGKSAAAQDLSARLGVPFLRSRDITRPILSRMGYDYASDGCVENFLSRKETEYSLVLSRVAAESEATDFVTDRTTLECFAYALLNCSGYTPGELSDLEDTCRSNMSRYTDLFYFPMTSGWYVANGLRTTDWWFQRKVDIIIQGLLMDWGVDFTETHRSMVDEMYKAVAGE